MDLADLQIFRSVVHAGGVTRAARTQAIRDLLGGLFRLLLRLPFAIAALWRAIALWHARRQAMRELNEFDDRALHDMGIRRSEIEAAVFGRPR